MVVTRVEPLAKFSMRVPKADAPVAATCSQNRTIMTPSYAMQLPVVPLERRLALPAFQVPNPGGGIARCRGEDAAVRRKCQAFYALSVTAQDLQTLADGQIP